MKPISETDLEQLSAYIDGELHGSERRFFEKRLAADPGLRAACERAWLASTVLKAQPFRLMPETSAADICARCDGAPNRGRAWALVASLAALTVAVGIGYRLWPGAEPNTPETVELAAKPASRAVLKPAGAAATVQSAPVVRRNLQRPQLADNTAPAATAAAADDPSGFELNEATRSKTWPKRDQALDDYLVRHNQMSGNAASDLISYAELLSEPDAAPEPQERP